MGSRFSNDDLMDINPRSEIDTFLYTYDTTDFGDEIINITASGESGDGWDGVLVFSMTQIDLAKYGKKSYQWTFNQQVYNLEWEFDIVPISNSSNQIILSFFGDMQDFLHLTKYMSLTSQMNLIIWPKTLDTFQI